MHPARFSTGFLPYPTYIVGTTFERLGQRENLIKRFILQPSVVFDLERMKAEASNTLPSKTW